MKLKFVLVLVLLAALAAAASNTTNVTNSKDSVDKMTQGTLSREKRTLGVDKNYKKEVEIKTALGSSIKISKTISYNDGGAIIHAPMLLDSLATNKIRVLQQLMQNKHHPNNVVRAGVDNNQTTPDENTPAAGISIGAGISDISGIGSQIATAGAGSNDMSIGTGSDDASSDIGINGQIGDTRRINRANHVVIVGGKQLLAGADYGLHDKRSHLGGLAKLIQQKKHALKQKLYNDLYKKVGGLASLLATKKDALVAETLSRNMMALSASQVIGPPCCPSGPCCPKN